MIERKNIDKLFDKNEIESIIKNQKTMNEKITQEDVNQMKYDDALSKLQEISMALENKQVPIDELTDKVKLANM